MKKIKILVMLAFIFVTTITKSQAPTGTITSSPIPTAISPNGLLDAVFDNYGNKYSINDITIGKSSNTNGAQSPAAVLLCTPGYFNLYFEVGSGMEGNSVVETDRRNVICQVFSDISAFINTPLTTNGLNNRVNIIVKNINPLLAGYNAGTNPNPSATSGVLGLASGFYNMPNNTTPGFGGIADNEIWKTIHTGIDSYQGVASPLYTTAGSSAGGTFFHGMVAFNFGNSNSPGINWHVTPSDPSFASNLYDLYSVGLHEVTHALGFASLINYTGSSLFGSGFNYYSRYDQFLKTSNASQYLIGNTGACSLYDFQFNVNPSILTPGCTAFPPTGSSSDNTPCSTAIRYVGATNVPVYTPSCYEAGSSLSHFEDECYPSATSPIGNNIYFTMSNANGAGVEKRSLTPEERLVLCDLGYSTKNTFGTITNHNNVTYASPVCPGLNVGGINDGIDLTNGNYLYTGNVNNPITIAGISNNDFPANSTYECLEIVFGTGILPVSTSGAFLYTPTSPGVHLLRYIPVSPNNERGNITYIFVYASSGSNCTISSCNLVPNGDFEQTNPVPNFYSQISYSCGWGDATNGSADLFHANSPSTLFDVPCNTFGYEPDRLGKNAYAGMWLGSPNSAENIYTTLATPLSPMTSYQLKVDYSLAEAVSSYAVPMQVYLSPTLPITSGPGAITISNPLMLFSSGTAVTQTNGWTTLTFNFTTGNSSGEQYIALGSLTNYNMVSQIPPPNGSFGCNYNTTWNSNLYAYYYVDNVSLVPIANLATFTPPSILCLGANQIITLDNYVSVPNGTFSGPGVSCSGGACTFDPNAVGAGNYSIDYTYTNGNGCTYTVSATITVVNANINVTASASPNTVCSSGAVTLTGGGATSYEWQPGTISGSPIVVNPTASTTYVVTGTDANGCKATASVGVTTIPLPVNLVASATSICSGAFINLTPSGATSYVLLPGNLPSTGADFVVNPTSSTVYDLTGTDANGCTGTAQISITVQNCSACTNCNPINAPGGILSSNATNGSFCINNNITIGTGTKLFINSEFKIAPNVQIIVPSGSTLIIVNSHLFSCFNMWDGIIVQNGGRLTITNSLVEDAKVAIDVTGNTQISPNVFTLTNSTFNRNDVAINIKGYTQTVANYPFAVNNCVITCRDIPFTTSPAPMSYPSAATISAAATNPGAPFTNSVINNSTYPETTTAAYLKGPFPAGTKPTAGIRLTNVGVTQNPQTATPTYFEFKLGGTLTNKNIIDNQRIGVDLMQSNFSTYNATYQNMTPYGVRSEFGGIGINANSQEVGNYRLQVTSVGGISAATGNKFVDCSRAINSVNYFEHLISFNDIRSSQVNGAPFLVPNHRGEFGVKSVTNRFRIYKVSNNTLYNVQNGIIMDGTFGPLSIPGIPTSGQYAGKINIDNNTIAPQIGTAAITTQYVADAIALGNISSNYYNANAPYPIFQIANNSISNVYRGINYNKWPKINAVINSNVITLVADPFVTNNNQYGIRINGSFPANGQSSVRSNDVTGYGITNPNFAGIISSQSTSNLVNCNSTTNTTGGIVFAGNCTGASFSQNTMTGNQYGFVLINSGFTGPLGATNLATDNRWPGTWLAPARYKTATINASAVGSPLWVRQVPPVLNPNGSGYTSFPTTSYGTDDYFWAVSNTGTLKYVAGAPANPTCPVLSSGGGGTNPAVSNFIQQLEEIALDQVTYAANQIAQARFINKANLLSMLKGDPSLTTASPILQTFTATSTNTSRDKFATVEDETTKGNLGSAGSVNASISPTIGIETNHKDFYNTLLNYANQSLTTADSITVVNLANACPFTDGSVVYQARALYNVMFDTYKVFLDNCEEENNNNSRLMKPEEEEPKDLSSLFDAAIFPNPGTSNFNIATFGLTEGNVDVTISDVTGKIVYENKLSVTNALTNFDIDVKSGVYFVKIHDSSFNKTLIKKLVVQQ